MRYALVPVALAALVLLSAACGDAGGPAGVAAAGPGGEEREGGRKVTASPPHDPRLAVGDPATTNKNGTTLTVVSYESPLAVWGASPERGTEFSGVEVRGCAGRDSEGSLGPGAFVLKTAGGARIRPEGFADEGAKVRRPALESMNPLPGECDRGFVTFQTPRGERPELVVYEEEFVLKNPIAWVVPGR